MGCQCAHQCAKNYLPNKKELDSQDIEKEEKCENEITNNFKSKKKIINYRNNNNNNNFLNNNNNSNSTSNLFQSSTNQYSSFNNINENYLTNNKNNNFNSNFNNSNSYSNFNNNNLNSNFNSNSNFNNFNSNFPKKKENLIDFDINSLPEDEFSKFLFTKINEIRIDPKSFIPIIQSNKKKIKLDKKNRLIFQSNVKVALYEGISIFDEAINSLQITQPMEKLIFNPHLCIKLPKNENEIKDRNYLKKNVDFICNNNGAIVRSYWRDIVKDPETSFILMIVDDCGTNNSGRKRKDLLNPNMKFIGINSICIGKVFSCYVVLSDK